MFYRISSLTLEPSQDEGLLLKKVAKELRVSPSQIERIKLYRKSLDARKGKVIYHYTVDAYVREGVIVSPSKKCTGVEKELFYPISHFSSASRPIVVGFGPAGMFAALLLARAGLCPIVLERGKKVEERVADVESFFLSGCLNCESNIQFGEGGAGTFSDGKLNTLLKDKNFRGRFVLEEFVKFGAPEEILYLNKPHIGTDKLRLVVKGIREEILRLGGEVLFQSRFLSLLTDAGKVCGVRYCDEEGEKKLSCTDLFLAIGHSARDTFLSLYQQGIPMEKKIFSIGVRIEHLQKRIDHAQYGLAAQNYSLPAASYKLAVPTSSGKNVYTFCMCPGGVVVPAASEAGGVVTNGMSNFARNADNANSALLWNVLPEELPENPLSGFAFQRELEEKAFAAGGGSFLAPCQLVGDFLEKKESTDFGEVLPSYARGVGLGSLDEALPAELCSALREAIPKMGKLLSVFDEREALLTGVESRATSPVRITRGEDFQSNVKGLYPVGEGSGYAGGIMSSAMDGMKAAEAFFRKLEENI